MANYKHGKIYKILSDETDKIYIGSTAKRLLSQRMGYHRKHYKSWLKGESRYVTSFELLQYTDARIVLLESFPCDTKDELRAEEQKFIDQFKDICVNKQKASTGITAKNKKDYNKKYEKTDQRKEYKKNYEKTQQRTAFKKKYMKEFRKRKTHCIYCDSEIHLADKTVHKKTKKHQANVAFFEAC